MSGCRNLARQGEGCWWVEAGTSPDRARAVDEWRQEPRQTGRGLFMSGGPPTRSGQGHGDAPATCARGRWCITMLTRGYPVRQGGVCRTPRNAGWRGELGPPAAMGRRCDAPRPKGQGVDEDEWADHGRRPGPPYFDGAVVLLSGGPPTRNGQGHGDDSDQKNFFEQNFLTWPFFHYFFGRKMTNSKIKFCKGKKFSNSTFSF